MTEIVLDASALLALLKDEPGGPKAAEGIAASRMSAVNFAEVVSHFIHAGMPPLEADAMLRPLPMAVVEADIVLANMAGRLRAATAEAGLSLGDRFCLALALRDAYRPGPLTGSGRRFLRQSVLQSSSSDKATRVISLFAAHHLHDFFGHHTRSHPPAQLGEPGQSLSAALPAAINARSTSRSSAALRAMKSCRS